MKKMCILAIAILVRDIGNREGLAIEGIPANGVSQPLILNH
jgi:hypothetical protein